MQNTQSKPSNEEILLKATDLSVVFSAKRKPVVALDSLSVSAKAGQVTGFVGPDGAGKTTLLRTAAGLLIPSSGSMHVLGHNVVDEINTIRPQIGYMPQKFGLYEDLTVQENLDLYADLQGVPIAERTSRYARLMKMTDLGQFTNRMAGQLSGGMKQKLGLACCLVKTPKLLILDEPTVGVDPVSRRDLWQIVYELVATDNVSVVLSTAYLDEAERCDTVVLLHKGKKVAEGAPKEFRAPVQNRVFQVTPPKGIAPRDVQAQLMQRDDVVDATIRSGLLRVVVSKEFKKKHAVFPEDVATTTESVPPVFEDFFVDTLGKNDAASSVTPEELTGDEGDGEQTSMTHSPPADGVVVDVHGLTKKFDSFTAVQNISFQVERGKIFGLLGANGAGKTTTFRMLCGLLKATGGDVVVAGQDMRRAPAVARSRIGYMAQKFSLYQQLTVERNLLFYSTAYGLTKAKRHERIAWALEEFELEPKRRVAAQSLPGGYKQRLAMAAAMLHEPDILFLDEPTSGADPIARREFWLRINRFAQQGVAVIVTTHFMEEAEYCDSLLIMAQGESLARGTPEEIRNLAKTPENPSPTVEDAFIALAEGNIASA